MLNGIQGGLSLSGMGMYAPRQPQPLTDEQKSQVQSILSQFDPESLTAEDAKSIFDQFREAGIQPNPEIRDLIADSGFDPEELRTLARPEGEPGPRGPKPNDQQGQAQGLNVSSLQSLQTILDQYDLSKDLSADQQNSLLTQLNQAGFKNLGFLLDLSA
jgi:hypothetical protein